MKEELDALVNQLLTPPTPLNTPSLYKLFTDCDSLFSKNSEPPLEVKALWLFLHDVKLQLQHWKVKADKLSALSAKTEELKRTQSEIKSAKDHAKQCKSRFDEITEQLRQPYQRIYETYEALKHQENPLLALPAYTGFRERQVLVSGLEETLTKELNAIKFDDLKLVLNSNWIKISDIQSQLKELELGLGSLGQVTLLKERENIQYQLDQHQRYFAEFTRYSKGLTKSLSHQEITATIQSLAGEIDRLSKELRDLDKEIERVNLIGDVKRDLLLLFNEAADKDNLLFMKNLQETISTSNLNPVAWFNWWMNKNYHADVQSMNQHHAYLSLLLKRYKLQSAIHLAQKKFENTRSMRCETPQEDSVEPGPEISTDVIIQRMTAYESSFSGEQCSHLELKQELDRLAVQASNMVARLSKAIELIQALSQLFTENTHLRTHNNILHGNDVRLTAIQIKKLTDETPVRKRRILELVGQISLCKAYLEQMNTLTEVEKQIAHQKLHELQLKRRQKELLEELKQTPDEASLAWEKTQLETGLQLQLKQLPALVIKPDVDHADSPVIKPNVPLSQEIEYHQKLSAAHQDILPLLENSVDEPFIHWYQQLFVALQSRVIDEARYYRAAQLLRDIHFELNDPHPVKPYAVLHAYQRLFPQPENDCDRLLKLKPPVPVKDVHLADVTSTALRMRLDSLYAHQIQMNHKHPREARLLEQATINLHQMANIAEDHARKESLQDTVECLTDPRYESLQNHRGFLTVVEAIAQFFTCLFRLVSSKADDNFRHRFFFVPTYSSHLLQSTSRDLISCSA